MFLKKLKIELPYDLAPIPGYVSGKHKKSNLKRYMCSQILCEKILCSQQHCL